MRLGKTCPHCGSTIEYQAQYCEYCNSPIEKDAGVPAYVKDLGAAQTGQGKTIAARRVRTAPANRIIRGGRMDGEGEADFLFADASASDGLMVCGFIGAYPAEIVIPASHDGQAVVEIGREAFKKLPVSSVTIPASVQKIGESAFENCGSLYEVKDGSGIQTIEKAAFRGCCQLASFPALHSSSVVADFSSFAGCYQLGLDAETGCCRV